MVSLLIGCFLNLGVINNQSPGELLSSIVAISLTIFLLGYIVWQYYFLMTRNLEEKRIVESFGELYDGLKLGDN
jgi:protein-S-isoprenylcysteine O-methyltransferase Ste14